MWKPKSLVLLLIMCLGVASLFACQPESESGDGPDAGLANPAAVYCEGLGYGYESRETAEGTDAACLFPDGAECGQWDFLSGRCGQEHSYCLLHEGVRLETNGNVATCVFANGATCDEFSYYSGECGPE